MAGLDDIKKRIEDQHKQNAQKNKGGPEQQAEKVDLKQVDKIVERMKKKYTDQGMEFEQVGGNLQELRSIIAEGEQAKINIQTVEDLQDFRSPLIKQLGRFYLMFRGPLEQIAKALKRLPLSSQIRYYLYSANMKFSLNQWLALTVSATVIITLFVFALLVAIGFAYEMPQIFSVLFALFAGILTFVVMILIPKRNAQKRGDAVSVELPFALRHMATELKAGIGLYKTIQTIATADYGVLSEEFARTVIEIEEGTDAKDALQHFAMRTQSKALRNALLHIVRALKTGGNLSDIMNTIAEDVSFDMRVKVRDYSEKMNFFGVIYIFIAIVAPVFLAIIGAILNAPISVGNVAIPPLVIAVIYCVGMPFILGFLIIYLKMTQPKV